MRASSTRQRIVMPSWGIMLPALLLIVAGLFVCVARPAKALNVAQGYHQTDASITPGMAVSSSKDTTPENPKIELANRGNIEKFVGIVTTVDETLLASPRKDSDILVANSGDVTVFLSDVNGSVKRGDLLTVSPLSGILMKAGDDDNFVVGTAIEDATSTVETKDVHTDQGVTKSVRIGSQKIDLQPHFRQVSLKKDTSALVIFGESITGGKKVSQLQVVVALVLFFIVLAVEGSVIYGAIQSSVSAIGRNPLAKKAVYRQLLQVAWMSFLILTFGFGVIFLTLWI